MLWRLNIIAVFMSNIVLYARTQTTETYRGTTVLHPYFTIPTLPKTYVDIFKPSMGGAKPMLGSTKATCWARGGVCVDIRECPGLRFDAAVAGCTRGFKICCQSFKRQPPTVGLHRRENAIEVFSSDLHELENDSVKSLAERNGNLISYVRRSQAVEYD